MTQVINQVRLPGSRRRQIADSSPSCATRLGWGRDKDTLAKGGGNEKENQHDPHPDWETGKGGAARFLRFGLGQFCLATPTDFFIVGIPSTTIGTIRHVLWLLVGSISGHSSTSEPAKQNIWREPTYSNLYARKMGRIKPV
jgi:hypothetical protein